VLLGGGNHGNGQGRFADKVIKVPSKRGPQALRLILDDFEANGNGQTFTNYYLAQGERYFYDFLKPLAQTDNLTAEDFIDWGNTERYEKAIGIGECAGVVIDLIATLLFESEEKITNAELALEDKKWAASIYHTYASMVNTAKALLTAENTKTNTHAGIIKDFDIHFVQTGKLNLETSFAKLVLQLKEQEPTADFAQAYLVQAKQFLNQVAEYRSLELASS